MPLVVPGDEDSVVPVVPELLELPVDPVEDDPMPEDPEPEDPMPEDDSDEDEPLDSGELELPLEDG